MVVQHFFIFLLSFGRILKKKKSNIHLNVPQPIMHRASSWLLFRTLCLRFRCCFIKLDRKRFPCIFHYCSSFFFVFSLLLLKSFSHDAFYLTIQAAISSFFVWMFSKTLRWMKKKMVNFTRTSTKHSYCWWVSIQNQRRKTEYNKSCCCWAIFSLHCGQFPHTYFLFHYQIFQLFGANRQIDTYGKGIGFYISHLISPSPPVEYCVVILLIPSCILCSV